MLQEFVKLLNLKPGQKVLDVGCGIGGGDFHMVQVCHTCIYIKGAPTLHPHMLQSVLCKIICFDALRPNTNQSQTSAVN